MLDQPCRGETMLYRMANLPAPGKDPASRDMKVSS